MNPLEAGHVLLTVHRIHTKAYAFWQP